MEKKSSKKCSLVIPVFNSEKTLEKSLVSARAQSLAFSEIIVVDNNSSDASVELAKSFNVSVIHCETQGPSAARNAGWQAAQSELVAFIDSDVILDKYWLENMLLIFSYSNSASNSTPNIVGAQSAIFPRATSASTSMSETDTLSLTDSHTHSSWLDEFRLERKLAKTKGTGIELFNDLNAKIINTAACIYKKETLLELNGFDENLRRLEDVDMSYKASYVGELSATAKAVAWVEYSGTWLQYLLRSFYDGQNSIRLEQLWGIKNTSPQKINFVTKKYRIFELALYIFHQLGRLSQKLKREGLPPLSLKTCKLVSAIRKMRGI